MAIKQLGTDYVLFVNTTPDDEPTWKVVMCQNGLTINEPFDVVDASSKCGPDSFVNEGQNTVEFDAMLLQNDPTDTVRMTAYEWSQLADTRDTHEFKAAPITATVDDVGKIVYEFEGVISNTTTTFNYNEMAVVSSTISVKGTIEKSEFTLTT